MRAHEIEFTCKTLRAKARALDLRPAMISCAYYTFERADGTPWRVSMTFDDSRPNQSFDAVSPEEAFKLADAYVSAVPTAAKVAEVLGIEAGNAAP